MASTSALHATSGTERPMTKYDEKVMAALKTLLRADHLAIIPHWMKVASLEDKRGIMNLQRLAESRPMRPPSGKWTNPEIRRTEFDVRVESALKNALKPELHPMVPMWMKGATLEEKRGILTKLDYHTESKLVRSIGRPMGRGPEPSVAVAPWYSPKWSPNNTMGGTGGMMRSRSMPGLTMGMEPPPYVVPTWMHEDNADVENIPKPGGARLKLKDSVIIQSMKNKERNSRGTFRLFGGQFDDTTTTGTAHSLDAIGMASTFA